MININLVIFIVLAILICYSLYLTYVIGKIEDSLQHTQDAFNNNADVLQFVVETVEELSDSNDVVVSILDAPVGSVQKRYSDARKELD